ncbi:MAG TPA: hypothetical protein DDZ80_28015 [Cyanobacteria bacterium UBA8803]|nr:hypothetical protein [Cyanobacteria bacterium UBA9273]HBL62110.1 hypothetical protein [Cyanobacteria bacterium UBA8803]
MLNKISWLTDQEIQDLGDREASLITGGQITTVPELRDVEPATWMSDPQKRRILLGEITLLAPQQGQR